MNIVAKLKIPKIKLPLTTVFWFVLVVVVLVEVLVLYKHLYGAISIANSTPEFSLSVPKSRLNQSGYENIKEFVSGKEGYKLPSYSLKGRNSGRDNPFGEYR